MEDKLQPHSFDINDAQKYGIEGAIILYNIKFWLTKNKANKSHINKLGDKTYYWTFNSVRAFTELFPYMTKSQITRTLKKLEDSGELISGEFNKKNYDRTKWYTICQFEILDLPEMTNGVVRNDKPIPDINTDINKHISSAIAEEEVFDSNSYIEIMTENTQKHIRLIGFFFQEKGFKFDTKAQVQESIKANVAVARTLTKIFSTEDIRRAILWSTEVCPDSWTIHTMKKGLTTNKSKVDNYKLYD